MASNALPDWQLSPEIESNIATPVADYEGVSNAEILGRVLYPDYILAFQLAGLILFVAMIGAIVLTLRTRPGVLRQSVAKQHQCKADDVLEIHKVTPRTGV